MSKNAIIEEVYKCQWFNDMLDKMNPENLRDDLKQETILVLLQMQDERIEQLHQDGYLKFYTIRTILNMIKSTTSKFFFMYRNYQEFEREVDQADDVYTESIELELCHVFDNTRNDLYERDMLEQYTHTFDCNALKMSRDTGIPYKTVIRTLNNAKTKIKCFLQSQHP